MQSIKSKPIKLSLERNTKIRTKKAIWTWAPDRTFITANKVMRSEFGLVLLFIALHTCHNSSLRPALLCQIYTCAPLTQRINMRGEVHWVERCPPSFIPACYLNMRPYLEIGLCMYNQVKRGHTELEKTLVQLDMIQRGERYVKMECCIYNPKSIKDAGNTRS